MNKKLPRICIACGLTLQRVDERKPVFDEYSGRSYLTYYLTCPKFGEVDRIPGILVTIHNEHGKYLVNPHKKTVTKLDV